MTLYFPTFVCEVDVGQSQRQLNAHYCFQYFATEYEEEVGASTNHNSAQHQFPAPSQPAGNELRLALLDQLLLQPELAAIKLMLIHRHLEGVPHC